MIEGSANKKKKRKREALSSRCSKNARSVALDVLLVVLRDSYAVQQVLDEALVGSQLQAKDKRLCTVLVYGTLRQKIRIDAFLHKFLLKPGNLPEGVNFLLEMALYEFFYLRIPDHAVIDSAVKECKRRYGAKLGGLVNGVLRSVQRRRAEWDELDSPALGQDEKALSVRYAIPEWIVHQWNSEYGAAKTEEYLKTLSSPAPYGVRLRPTYDGDTAFEGAVYDVDKKAFAFAGSLPEPVLHAIQEGKAVRQSVASYEVLKSLKPEEWKGPVWDCCCGRGGKTAALLDMGIDVSLASDTSEQRIKGLLGDAALNESPPFVALCSAATDPKHKALFLRGRAADAPERFGTVFIDAPCSGLGTLSRRPEIRFRRTKENIRQLALLQAEILRGAATKILPGGHLVYVTCTLSLQENQHQLEMITKLYPTATLVALYESPSTTPLEEFFFGFCLKMPS